MKLVLKNKNIVIVHRLQTENAVEMANQLAEWLIEKKYKIFTAADQSKIKGATVVTQNTKWSQMALVIVLGGDGTYLKAVRMLQGARVPVLGFNMGSLGFLTAHPAEDVFRITEKALKNQLVIHKRSVVKACLCETVKKPGSVSTEKSFKINLLKNSSSLIVKNKKMKFTEFAALNDIVIERGSHSQLISTTILTDNQMVSQVKADGLIISTPTGSTAYNLAAGGPILHPEVKAVVVTPVSPHSLTSRPLIFPQNKAIHFRIDNPDVQAHLIVDGQKVAVLGPHQELVVQICDYDHFMVRESNHNFFHLLREKLKFGDRS